jgi:cytoskeleton protein RodZ
MTDNADDSGQQAAAEPRAGQRLAIARRANNISMRDIAKELHLDEVKVQALEDNRFDVLGAPVFAKGYLRKYAELVNVPIDDVMADYYRMNRTAAAPPVVGPRRPKAPSGLLPGPWIVGFVILAVAAAGAWWWLDRVPASPGPAEPQPAPGRIEPATAATESAPDAQPAEDVAFDVQEPSPGTEATSDSAAPEADPPADLPAASGAGETRLQLDFTGDCWTEVTDAMGRRLYFGLGTDGRSITVSGEPPLRVLLGNNDNASLRVDGEIYTVRPSELRGNTARLSIGGP